MISAPLSGIRIWLSGTIPENASPEQADRLRNFAATLAQRTFREGARIHHGFHPSLVPTLLETAVKYPVPGNRAPLSLFVSTHFLDSYQHLIPDLQHQCDLQQIPQGTDRDHSLALLRDALASQADVLIAIGGKWWSSARDKAGVPAEFHLAVARGIPTFILGGLDDASGAASGYLAEDSEILGKLRNGLDESSNRELSTMQDIDELVDRVLRQIARLPLGRRETASGQRFRILSLDGGGIRGAFTAAVLAQWERLSNARAADHFDLIAGTSTGGILALGLGLGMSALEIVDFYRKHGPEIFPVTGLVREVLHKLKRVATAKFDAKVLEAKLSAAYDRDGVRRLLRDSAQRLVITSYNLTTNDINVYRTSHHPTVPGHDDLAAVVVARATSAAPTYFETAMVADPLAPHEAVDGGVWANCPAIAALDEAVGVLKVPLDRIDMLSIGTAGLPTLVTDPALQGMVGWGPKAPDLLMNAQMDATLRHMQQILGERFLRVDDERARIEGLDEVDALDYLIGRGAKVAVSRSTDVLGRFLNGVRAQPWRTV